MDNKVKSNNTNKVKATTKLNTPPYKNNKSTNKDLTRNIIIVSFIFIISSFIFYSFLFSGVKVQGKVFDSKDSSVILTGVSITLDDNKTIENNTLTGGFIFEKVSKGLHTLKVSRTGYKLYQKDFEVSSNIKIDIPLDSFDKIVKQSNLRLVLSNSNSNNLTIIEPELDNKVTSIVVGERPSDFVLLSEKQKMYVSSPSQGTISVVDMNSKSESKKITFDKIYQMTRLELSPNRDKLYILATGAGKMFVVDTNTDEVTSSFDVAIMTSDFKVDSLTGNIIVLDNIRIATLNPAGSLIREHKFVKGDFYEKLILDSNNTTAYVTHSIDPIMLKVELNTDIEKTVTLKERARDILSDSNKQLVYVLYDSSLAIFKNDTFEEYKPQIPTGGKKGVSLFRFKEQVYISNMDSNNISTFDLNSMQIEPKLITTDFHPKKIIVF